MWIAAGSEQVLGSYIPPAAYEATDAVLHVHVVEPDALNGVMASIESGAYPTESPYIPVPLAGLDELLANLPLMCRLGSLQQRESLMAWLEVWTFIDEEGRTRTLAERLWDGQRRFLEALLNDGHVLSIKARKVGLSTFVLCARCLDSAHPRRQRLGAPPLLPRRCCPGVPCQPSPRFRGAACISEVAAHPRDVDRGFVCSRSFRYPQPEGLPGNAERSDRGNEFAPRSR
jgi:hypothetical protein